MGNKLEQLMPVVFAIAGFLSIGLIVMCWKGFKMAEVGNNSSAGYVSSTEAARSRRLAKAAEQSLSADFSQDEQQLMGDLEIGSKKPKNKGLAKLKGPVRNPMFRSSGDTKNSKKEFAGNAPLTFKPRS